ncbi:sodium:solute symporter family protein [Sedimentitalea sp.]|uniref:sodium:solute symporter family protein n=1 Tax=Sedimentitalea sp. TaxID=2048915 RepID=UPI0032976C49
MEQTYENGSLVIAGLGIYMLLLLAVGWWASKRVSDEADFLVAGRRLGLPLMVGALVATWFGAGTTMGASGATYLFGVQGVVFDPFGAALCLVLLGVFFARVVRRSKFMTLVDFFESRYNSKVAGLSALVMLIAEMGWIGALLVGFGSIITFFTGIPLAWGIGISTLVLIAYTVMGGMYAVTMTDSVQIAVVTVSMIAIFVIVMGLPEVGGWDYILSNDPSHNWMGINQWDFFPTSEARADAELGNAGFNYYTGHMGWFYWLAAIMAVGVGSIAAQDVNQRLMSAKSENVGVASAIVSGIVYIILGMIPVILGVAAFKLYPDMEFDVVQNQMLLVMAADYLPTGLVIIFVCGLVAALMSSAAAATLAGASIVGYNGGKMLNPNISDEASLRWTRIFVPVVACVSLVIALKFEVIYNLMVAAWTLLLVSNFVPYACGFFWKKANSAGALAAMIGGFLGWIAGFYYYLPITSEANTGVVPGVDGVYQDWANWDAIYIGSIWGVIASVTLMVVVSLATQKSVPPKPVMDADGQPLDMKGWSGLVPSRH